MSDGDQSRQDALDVDQASADLDQGIADREQARATLEQAPLDTAQRVLDAEGSSEELASSEPSRAERQADLGLAQDRHDAHQAQLDGNQDSQMVRQAVLDEQQTALSEAVQPAPSGTDARVAEATRELEMALRARAEAKLARADEARQRAADALLRRETSERRGPDRA